MIKLLKFYSETCGPCKRMAPIIEEAMKDIPDVKVVEIDVGKGGLAKARELGIRALTTFVIEVDGMVKDMRLGEHSVDDIKKFIAGGK